LELTIAFDESHLVLGNRHASTGPWLWKANLRICRRSSHRALSASIHRWTLRITGITNLPGNFSPHPDTHPQGLENPILLVATVRAHPLQSSLITF
jgi:hypothetical protein